ncbi:MAG: TlpA family protein disulfide reductase [Deltaproteobacteria bacterium]|nr:TlpA disulfide reductase family protein [Candidatus Deferrimicrobiaceae bacterium]
MKRLWIAIGILAVTSAYGIPTCPAHGEEHGGAASSTRSEEGVRFVDFTLRDPDGVPVTFGNLVGKKPVLLLFWAAWCPICMEDIPAVNEIHRRGDMQVVAVNVKESAKRVKGAIRSLGIRYPVLLDPDGAVAQRYKVPGIPVCIVIDKAGRIVYRSNAFPDPIEKFFQ